MKRILSALLVVVLALTAAGCGQSTACVSEKGSLPYRVTVVLPHNDGTYWSTVAAGIQQANEEWSNLDIDIQLPQLNYNVDQMTALIRKATAAQVDAIVVQGNQDTAYCDALCEAQKNGICVALVDTDTDLVGPHLYVGTDNYEAGEMIGRQLIRQAAGTQSNVAVISGSEGYSNLEQRLNGFEDVIADSSNIRLATVQYDNYDSLTVLDIIRRLEKDYPDVNTLVCIEGTGGQTIGSNYTAADCPFPNVLAFDDAKECVDGLRTGSIQAIAAQQPEQMGYQTIQDIGRQLAEKSTGTEDTIFTTIKILTAANLKEAAE